jgi:D-alanyl-lipoteichoic acid acyltransferase DltB (MBOAT superfamily)
MLFSTWPFIVLFLPITFAGFFLLNKARLIIAGKVWLVCASLFFYGYWNWSYLPLIVGSTLFNFAVGTGLTAGADQKKPPRVSRKAILAFGIVANLALLGYFKYADFFIDNFNHAAGTSFPLPLILLPLGLSFFTFLKIAYLVDSYRGEAREYDLLNFSLFVVFFPALIAGPIVHHREMMTQFASRWTLVIRYRNVLIGLLVFSIGLFKKVVLADTLSHWAAAGFASQVPLDFYSAWATSLSFTFQLYFDFSGYCDMAVGAALLFNIKLPINFYSPYKALDIQDFWRRWHMTLSRWLRDYLYIPLGGNRGSRVRTYLNLMATFVIGGFWHGASWMFVIWGALHGGALIVHRIWSGLGGRLPKPLAWLLTFMFVNVAWVFFQAKSVDSALMILSGMVDMSTALHSIPVSDIPVEKLAWGGTFADHLLARLPHGLAANFLCYVGLLVSFILIAQKNSVQWMQASVGPWRLGFGVALFCSAFYVSLASTSSVFLYFNF